MEKIQYFQMEFKAIPVEGKEKEVVITEGGNKKIRIKGLASTSQLDRYNDIVDPEAFIESVKTTYKDNPIILFAHDDKRPVGRSTFLSVLEKGFYIEAEVMDAEIVPKIEAKFLKTFSIGYIPKKLEFRDEEDNLLDPKEDNVWRQGVKRILKELDLVEISIVSVPANPGALFTMEKSVKSLFSDMAKNEGEEIDKEPKDLQKDNDTSIILDDSSTKNPLKPQNMPKKNLLDTEEKEESKEEEEEKEEQEKEETDKEKEEEKPNDEEAETSADETSGDEEGDETSTEGDKEAGEEKEEEKEKEKEKEKEEKPDKESEEVEEGKDEGEDKALVKKIMTKEGAKITLDAVRALQEKVETLETILKETPSKKALAYFESSVTGSKKTELEDEKKPETEKSGFIKSLEKAAY